ncbi:MAG: glycosyltransferase family 4 protein [Alphaproteobacteria bacterium]|nr:glycosyltransferase family 4 protein [Alphaproteobacteria bacterium]MCB9695572.1 glycosyltransferase family 4 protein [Alphaproteobacteria bacterium]
MATDGFTPELVWERFDPSSAAPARRARCRRIVEVNAPVAWERRWPESPRPRELRRQARILEGADAIAVSRWLVDHLRTLGVTARHVPNGIEPLPPGDRERTRATLGLTGPTAVYLGTMHRWQGADWLPALLDALDPRWTLLVAGDGAHPPTDHPRLRRLGRVPPERVPDVLAAADVGLAPYDPAGPPWFCPLKVLAYRAAGLPVVGTDTGDVGELVGNHGIVLGDRAPHRWASAVRAVLDHPREPWVRSWDAVVVEALRT